MSDARKTTTFATSAPEPSRRTGMDFRTSSRYSGVHCLVISVSMGPGQIALTRIPKGARSHASFCVRELIPALETP